MSADIFYNSLIELGLTKIEIELYLLLLKTRNYNWTKIAQNLGISRVTLYQNLENLENKQFITKLGRNYTDIQALPPEKVLNLLRQKTLNLTRQSESLEQVLPDIVYGLLPKSKNTTVQFFEGKTQFRLLFESLLDSGQPILHFGSNELFADLVGYDYFKNYITKRIAKKIFTREITYNFPYYQSIKDQDKNSYREIKLLPKEQEKAGSYVVVDKFVTLWNPVLPRIIKIEDYVLAEFFRSNFEIIWNTIT